MQHLVFTKAGHVEWQAVDEPSAPGAHDAIVHPIAVARCDLDLPMASLGLFPGPFPVGHEVVGDVVSVGPAVERHRPGDTVIVPFQVSCGSCAPCERSVFAACAAHRAPLGASFGFGSSGGGFGGAVADLLPVPHADHMLVKAPQGIAPSVLASLSDNVADGYRAVAPGLQDRPAGDVLVIADSGGAVPLYAVLAAQALGAGRVRYIDRNPVRAEVAASFGSEAKVQSGPWPRRFDPAAVVVESAGNPSALLCALRSTEPYGMCTTVSVSFQPVTVPVVELYTRGITFHASRADGRRLLPAVIDLVSGGRLDPLTVPTTIVPWETAADTWLTPAIKLVVSR